MTDDHQDKTDPIIIADRIFVPASQVDQGVIAQHYEVSLYEEKVCAKCPHLEERHCWACDPCPANLGQIKLWSDAEYRGKPYYAVPAGHPRRVSRLLDIDLDGAIDRRPKIPFRYPIRWIGKLYRGQIIQGHQKPNQYQLVRNWWQTKNGNIQSPPRTGKTVLGTFLVTQLRVKTIIVAHQEDLLENFLDEFLGNAAKNEAPKTNVPQLRRKTGKRIIDIVRKMSDFDELDVCLVSYQKFIRKTGSDRIRRYINGKFSFLIVDEVHSIGAEAYSRFINRLMFRYRLGLSAHPMARKDGRAFIVRDLMGPIVAKSQSVSMVPRIELWETGIKPQYDYKSWAGSSRFWETSSHRNKLIVNKVFKDLRDGHEAVIIPVDRRKHVSYLVDRINARARDENSYENGNWPRRLALPYMNGVDRKTTLQAIDSGQSHVLVAMRSMVRMGIDLSLPSCLFIVIPMSGSIDPKTGAPMFWQLTNRAATFKVGKRTPIIRLMIDDMGASIGCFRSLFFKEILPNLKSVNGAPPRYSMGDLDFKRSWEIVKSSQGGDYVPKPRSEYGSSKVEQARRRF